MSSTLSSPGAGSQWLLLAGVMLLGGGLSVEVVDRNRRRGDVSKSG